jgi:hypothetical protein
VTIERETLRFVGEGAAEHLEDGIEYLTGLLDGSQDLEDVIRKLDEAIRAARAQIESLLTGYDSFDTLAFFRMYIGPWDLNDFRESESSIETSQSAQDVVALTALGMGLPRQRMTGENSGQPDQDRLIALGAEIVRAASIRALLQGRLVEQPLGALAGALLGQELAVRGRQYQAIATEVNTALLGDESVRTVLSTTLGFDLEDVRAVREAGVALLNERFFGARDRLGDIVEAGEPESATVIDEARSAWNLMFNECRLFGAVSAAEVAERTGLEERVTRSVLDFFGTTRPSEGSPNPVEQFTHGQLPAPWGLIADGDEYLMLNAFLSEDEMRRDIERGLTAATHGKGGSAAKVWPRYDARRAAQSEKLTADAISHLLSGTDPRWQGQKYLGPVDLDDVARLGRDDNPATVTTKKFESDLLFVIDGVALCVEVKAGSITDKARRGNARRLATDLEKTIKEANEQADRLTRLISTNRGVWDINGKWIDLPSIGEVHSIVVMLDDMGLVSMSMSELAHQGIVDTDEVPWIVTLHDLIVASRTFDHPAQFLQFLRRRRGRKLSAMVTGVDELDMLMWFINGGMHFDADPHTRADQLPIDVPAQGHALRAFEEQGRVHLGTLTDPLDAWFYFQGGQSDNEVPRPTRREEPWIEQFLTAAEEARSPGWLRFGADLVGLSGKAQRELGTKLKKQIRAARGADREQSLTTHGTSPTGAWLLCAAVVPDGVPTAHLPDYVDAKQYQTASNRAMLLTYAPDGSLTGSRYRGDPPVRTAEQDEAVSMTSLRSLTATFATLPPSARRSTKRLRGKPKTRRK